LINKEKIQTYLIEDHMLSALIRVNFPTELRGGPQISPAGILFKKGTRIPRNIIWSGRIGFNANDTRMTPKRKNYLVAKMLIKSSKNSAGCLNEPLICAHPVIQNPTA